MDLQALLTSAEKNDIASLIELGRIYREGDGVDADVRKAISYLSRAAGLGAPMAASSLGYIYLVGEGVDADPELAEKYLRTAADSGDTAAMCNMGVLLSSTDQESSFEWFLRAAELGSVRAMKNIAAAYSMGQGAETDKQASAEWYSKAAELGDTDSMCVLASMLRNGDGIPVDKARAAELYRRAADAGDSEAQYDLAFMLDSGEGIAQDRDEAERYFRMSAQAGDMDACLCMGGILFERGEFAEAEGFFMSAAMKGDVKAQYNLGLLYIGEYLGQPDPAKAREWFEYASEEGFAFAQTMLGTMDLDAGDVGSAEENFRRSAEQGEPTAQYNLGALGLSNQIKMDYKEAVEWLTKAAQQGMEPAYRLLMQMNSQQ